MIGRVPVYPEAQRTFLPIYAAVQPEVQIGPLPPRKTHLPQCFSLSLYAIARALPPPLSPPPLTPRRRRGGKALLEMVGADEGLRAVQPQIREAGKKPSSTQETVAHSQKCQTATDTPAVGHQTDGLDNKVRSKS